MRRDLSTFSHCLSGPFPISSFTRGSIITFSENTVHILRNFNLLRDQTEYDQHIKITPVPAIPEESQIDKIAVSPDGLRVVLSGKKSVFVLLVGAETLSSRIASIEVFCECLSVSTDSLQRGSATVLETKFLPENFFSGCSIAFLSSDNHIRIYNIVHDNIVPLADVDFNSHVLGGGPSLENTFGLYNTIVSFDFISCDNRMCMLAVDNDGQLYTAVVIENEAPIVKTVISPPGLPLDPFALFSIQHSFSKVFSVFAMFSHVSDGVLSHFILLPGDEGGFEAVLQEKINMPARTKQISFVPSTTASTYFLGCTNRLYLVDIRPWIGIYGIQLTQEGLTSSMLPDSRMHIVAASLDESPKNDLSVLGQTAVIVCKSEGVNLTLLITRFSSPPLFVSFIKSEFQGLDAIDGIPSAVKSSSFKESVVDPILSRAHILPKFTGGLKQDTKRGLNEFEQWCAKLTENIELNHNATQLTVKRVASLVPHITTMEREKGEMKDRLNVLYKDVTSCFDEVIKRKRAMETLANRIFSLATRAGQMRPLTSQEKRMLNTLKDYRKQVFNISEDLSKMSIAATEEKRALFGPAKSFQPSGSSFKANIDRNTREIDALKARVSKIASSVDCDIGDVSN